MGGYTYANKSLDRESLTLIFFKEDIMKIIKRFLQLSRWGAAALLITGAAAQYIGCSACHGSTTVAIPAKKTPGGSKISGHNKGANGGNDHATSVLTDASSGALTSNEGSGALGANYLVLSDNKNCVKCGARLPEEAKFCYICGTSTSDPLDSQSKNDDKKIASITPTIKEDKKSGEDIAYTVSYKDPNFDLQKCRASADSGNNIAQYNLAMCYLYGYNVSKSGSEAIKYFHLSASAGNSESARKLGNCYYYGDGVAQDRAEAVKWYLAAANKGDALAQCNLGECYFDGEGVAVDKVQAMYWYLSAAKNGDPTAQEYIGECSLDGVGMARDPNEAFRWFTKAAKQGNVTALYNLGWCYNNGVGCEKNEEKAIKYLTDAAKQGDEDATDLLKEIEDVKKKREEAKKNPPPEIEVEIDDEEEA